jgi:hypothetical protein
MKEITKLICRSLGQKCWLLHTSTCAFHFQQPRTSHIYICMFVDYTSMIPRECPIPIPYAWLRLKLGYPKIPYVTYKTSWAESLMQVLAIRCTKGSLKTLPTWTMGYRQASCYIRRKQWTSKYVCMCVCVYVCMYVWMYCIYTAYILHIYIYLAYIYIYRLYVYSVYFYNVYMCI